VTDIPAPKKSAPKKRGKVELKGRLPAVEPGKPPREKSMTPAEVRAKAEHLLRDNRSNERYQVFELLYEFVALTEDQLFRLVEEKIAVSEGYDSFARSVRNYRERDDMIARVPPTLMREAKRAGLNHRRTHTRSRAWVLDAVGEDMARLAFTTEDNPVPLANTGSDAHRVHDLLCSEVMLRMREAWAAKKITAETRGTNKVAIWEDKEEGGKGAFLIVPDGLLIKYKPDESVERAYLVEFHYAPLGGEVKKKIQKYERIGKPENAWLWDDHWSLSEMPFVLVIYRHAKTLRRYQEELARHYSDIEPHCSYLSLDLQEVWNGNPLAIKPLRVRKEKKG